MMTSLRTGGVLVVASAGSREHRRQQHRAKTPSRRGWLVGNAAVLQVAMSLAGPSPASSSTSAASPAAAQRGVVTVEGLPVVGTPGPVGYSQQTLQVGGDVVPLSVWYPAEAKATADFDSGSVVTYTQRTSFGKLFRTFLKLPVPGWLFNSDRALPASPFVSRDAQPLPGTRPAVVLAHGYLGSRFDLLHLAERLAAQGVLVLAPEFPDARSGDVESSALPDTSPATRADILQAVMGSLGTYDVNGVGLVGHSAGSGTISRLPGSFARVSIAGFVPQADAQPTGPYLVVHSSGDSTIEFQGGMKAVKGRLAAAGYQLLSEEGSPVQALASSPPNEAQRAALLLSEPNHISFLSERSNEAMLATLAFLLPLARLLKLRLLDFDKYFSSRDSRATAAVYVPIVEQFLMRHLAVDGKQPTAPRL